MKRKASVLRQRPFDFTPSPQEGNRKQELGNRLLKIQRAHLRLTTHHCLLTTNYLPLTNKQPKLLDCNLTAG